MRRFRRGPSIPFSMLLPFATIFYISLLRCMYQDGMMGHALVRNYCGRNVANWGFVSFKERGSCLGYDLRRDSRSISPKCKRLISTEEHASTDIQRKEYSSSAMSNSTVSTAAYPFAEIEEKWQRIWDERKVFSTPHRTGSSTKRKKYILDMFPYPSGAGLHVGHPEGYTASDVMARYYRMNNYDVLHPIGWDAFGLPAEQFAIQTGTQPTTTTKKNISTFKRQLKMLGFSYDWDKELATTDAKYYKWTQWIFLQLFRKGLAKQEYVPVNWCPDLGTVLANEEVINGLSERGSYPVERLPLRQWILKITEYANVLEQGLSELDWPQGTLVAQRQWIGRSEGCAINFEIDRLEGQISVFTTRADTIMGVTYVTVAPEHPLISQITTDHQRDEVSFYTKAASCKSDLDRTASKEKSGVFTGGFALHPITGKKLPIWTSDYVLGSYGTGAVMAVPAHDIRDMEFAQKYGLDVKWVVAPSEQYTHFAEGEVFVDEGVCINSGEFNGMPTAEAKSAVANYLEGKSKGESVTNYKLRDWVFSRQRYWGEPIPIYFPVSFPNNVDIASVDLRKDENVEHQIEYNIPLPVPEKDLPLELPPMKDFEPGIDPAGCLARAKDWRYFKQDGQWFARETNTMPQWAGSCWYYFRYLDPNNENEAFSKDDDRAWLPVDLYVGGAEHAVLHLLYARFWHRVLYDLGYTQQKEPFTKLVHQGMILGSDGEKMSKSRGNVVNPDDIVGTQGADALRMYEMFMGPLEAVKPWQTSQVAGVVRFRDKVFFTCKSARADVAMSIDTTRLLHKTMKKVTQDIESMSFNTAISALMVFTNHLQSCNEGISKEAAEKLALMVSPLAPHLGEECWSILGHAKSLAYHSWVKWDEELCADDVVRIGVQVNGKARGEIEILKTADEQSAMDAALKQQRVVAQIDGKVVKKVVYVPGRILNIVAK